MSWFVACSQHFEHIAMVLLLYCIELNLEITLDVATKLNLSSEATPTVPHYFIKYVSVVIGGKCIGIVPS